MENNTSDQLCLLSHINRSLAFIKEFILILCQLVLLPSGKKRKKNIIHITYTVNSFFLAVQLYSSLTLTTF